jgi:hypothetical protein
MHKKKQLVTVLFAIATLIPPVTTTATKGSRAQQSEIEITGQEAPVLWRNPVDIRSRDLFLGAGGKEHAPHTVFTFIKEDLHGTSPKFDVRTKTV